MTDAPTPRVHRVITATFQGGPLDGTKKPFKATDRGTLPMYYQPDAVGPNTGLRGVYRAKQDSNVMVWLEVPKNKPLPVIVRNP